MSVPLADNNVEPRKPTRTNCSSRKSVQDASCPAARADLVDVYVREFRDQIQNFGDVTVVSAAVVAELTAFVTLLEAEVAGRSRRIGARLEALRQALQDNTSRGHATNHCAETVAALRFHHEVDSHTAARLIGMKPDTLRKALREDRIPGRRLNGRWLVSLAAINGLQKAVA
jgi:hypothetical protein